MRQLYQRKTKMTKQDNSAEALAEKLACKIRYILMSNGGSVKAKPEVMDAITQHTAEKDAEIAELHTIADSLEELVTEKNARIKELEFALREIKKVSGASCLHWKIAHETLAETGGDDE